MGGWMVSCCVSFCGLPRWAGLVCARSTFFQGTRRCIGTAGALVGVFTIGSSDALIPSLRAGAENVPVFARLEDPDVGASGEHPQFSSQTVPPEMKLAVTGVRGTWLMYCARPCNRTYGAHPPVASLLGIYMMHGQQLQHGELVESHIWNLEIYLFGLPALLRLRFTSFPQLRPQVLCSPSHLISALAKTGLDHCHLSPYQSRPSNI